MDHKDPKVQMSSVLFSYSSSLSQKRTLRRENERMCEREGNGREINEQGEEWKEALQREKDTRKMIHLKEQSVTLKIIEPFQMQKRRIEEEAVEEEDTKTKDFFPFDGRSKKWLKERKTETEIIVPAINLFNCSITYSYLIYS